MNAHQLTSRIYIEEQALMLDGFRLGKQIYQSGFYPDFIAGVWRGGCAVGIVVQECLQYYGVDADHFPIRTSYSGLQSYQRMVSQADQIGVHGIDYLVERLDADHKLLLVDDVYSSGFSAQAVINKLQRKTRQNMPQNVKTAAVWYRPSQARPAPDFYVNQTDQWLVLPYELSGLSKEEIDRCKPDAADAIKMLHNPAN